MAVVPMLSTAGTLNPATRKPRTPNFPFTGTMRPTGVYPLAAFRVLPGETMRSFSMPYRIVSRNLKNPLEGAWLNMWLVYVKLSDLDDEAGTLREQFYSPDTSSSGFTAGSDRVRFFTKSGQIDWIKMAYDKVIESYFRDDSESAADQLIDTVCMQKIRGRHWGDNLLFDEAAVAVTTSDRLLHESAQQKAVLEHMMDMSEESYDTTLQAYGVSAEASQVRRPEILRYGMQFSMPANHVEPSTGAPVSAWYFDGTWRSGSGRRSAKRFNEPGFVLALCSVMPKFYLAHFASSQIGNAWAQPDWFPWYNMEDPTRRMNLITVDPAGNEFFTGDARSDVGSVGYWYDRGDELSHGEPFINNISPPWDIPFSTGMTFNDGDSKQVSRGEYCTESDVDNLFTGSTAAERLCQYGGLLSVRIDGHVADLI